MVAAIGIAVGVHAHLLAFGTTVLTLVVLLILAWAERRAGTRRHAREDRTQAPTCKAVSTIIHSTQANPAVKVKLRIRTRTVPYKISSRPHRATKTSTIP